MIGMNAGPGEKMATSNSNEICIVSDALAVDGVAPEVGDEVEFMVGGKIVRDEGGKSYVKPSTINGQPVADEGTEPTMDDLEQLATDADAMRK